MAGLSYSDKERKRDLKVMTEDRIPWNDTPSCLPNKSQVRTFQKEIVVGLTSVQQSLGGPNRPLVQMVMNLPAMQKTQVQSLGREDPQEKEMATHSSILAWRSPWTEEPGGLHSMGSKKSQT